MEFVEAKHIKTSSKVIENEEFKPCAAGLWTRLRHLLIHCNQHLRDHRVEGRESKELNESLEAFSPTTINTGKGTEFEGAMVALLLGLFLRAS